LAVEFGYMFEEMVEGIIFAIFGCALFYSLTGNFFYGVSTRNWLDVLLGEITLADSL
jgi:hypothetical protein